MRGERDLDAVVDVEPFGMMVMAFRQQSNAVHEAPRFAEIAELELTLNRLAFARNRPFWVRG